MDLLNDVNQQLGETEADIEGVGRTRPMQSSPCQMSQLTEPNMSVSHIKFSSPSPNKSISSPSKRHMVISINSFLQAFIFLKPVLDYLV